MAMFEIYVKERFRLSAVMIRPQRVDQAFYLQSSLIRKLYLIE